MCGRVAGEDLFVETSQDSHGGSHENSGPEHQVSSSQSFDDKDGDGSEEDQIEVPVMDSRGQEVASSVDTCDDSRHLAVQSHVVFEY